MPIPPGPCPDSGLTSTGVGGLQPKSPTVV